MKNRSVRLYEAVAETFDEEELRTLAFEIGVNYDNLPASGAANKARELVAHLERRGRLNQLIEEIQSRRPQIDWPARLGSAEEASPGRKRGIDDAQEFAASTPTLRFRHRPIGILMTRSGPEAGLWVFITEKSGKITVGRSADISFPGRTFSRRHFSIIVKGPEEDNQYRVMLLDMISTNYTYLNGRRLLPGEAVELREGDVIRVGDTELVYRLA